MASLSAREQISFGRTMPVKCVKSRTAFSQFTGAAVAEIYELVDLGRIPPAASNY